MGRNVKRTNKRKKGRKRRKKKTKKLYQRGGMKISELIEAANNHPIYLNDLDLSGLEINNEQLKELMPHLSDLLSSKVSLNLSNNHISDIGPLEMLEKENNIESLDISNQTHQNGKTKEMDLIPILGLTSLRVLSISNANIKNISPLKELINLQVVFLAGNDIKDFEALEQMELLWVQLCDNEGRIYNESYTVENDGVTPPNSPKKDDTRRQGPRSRSL